MRSSSTPRGTAICSERGFTLIELLIAVTIAAMVIALGAMAIRSFLFAQQRQKALSERLERFMLFRYLLFKQLQNVPPRVFNNKAHFAGEEDALRFVSRVPVTGPFFPGIFGVEYLLNGTSVLERDCPIVDSSDYSDFRSKRLCNTTWHLIWKCDNCTENLAFSYFYGGRWNDRCSGNLPKAVALQTGERLIALIPIW